MLKNVRHAARVLRKNLGFTTVAVSSLAIGIGANSAMFGVADALLLRPLPVWKPDQIVNVISSSPSRSFEGVSYGDYVDFRDRNRTFDGLVATSMGASSFAFSQSKDELPEVNYSFFVSGNFFKVLGVEPVLGRAFRPNEDKVPKRDAVVVLGHDFWASTFGANPSVIGRKIRLNNADFTIIGVAPERFTGIDQYFRPALYVPIAMAPAIGAPDSLENRASRWLAVKGRLKPGLTTVQAQADLASIARVLQKTYPETNRDTTTRVETEFQLRVEVDPPDAQLSAMLMVLSACVLLVACANVAGLLLSRSRSRAREIAIRLAIGAGRSRLIGQLLLESALIAALGGAAGVLIAYGATKFFGRLQIPSDLPISISVELDHRVVLFTLAASFLSTIIFGLAPAFRSTKTDLVAGLKAADADSGKKQRLWGRNLLVAGQIAVSLVLLTVSALMFRGFQSQLSQGPGFRTDHLLMMSLDTSVIRYTDAQTQQFQKQVLERTRSLPSVESAAWTGVRPMAPQQTSTTIALERRSARPEQPLEVNSDIVSDRYFETLRVNILRGRGFLESDTAQTPRVAVVNQQFANHYWPNQDPIGKRFHLDSATGPVVQIVGVAKTAKYVWIGEAPMDFIYLPLSQNPRSDMSLVIWSRTDPATLASALRHTIREFDANIPIHDVRTMADFYNMRAIEVPDTITQTIGTLGCMGMALAMIGLYGLIAYSVSRRTREIGIRMAIGANRANVLRMVLKQGFLLAVCGIALGIAGSIASSRVVGFLFNGTHTDAPAIVIMVVLQFAVTLLATYVPARRASLIDPMRALREE